MGTKTPENERRRNYGDTSNSDGACHVGGEPRGSHMHRDGDGCLGDAGGDDESDGDGDGDVEETSLGPLEAPSTTDVVDAKKKRKKNKKKKSKTKKATPLPVKQSFPPRVLLTYLFPSGEYPEGEMQNYTKSLIAAAEARYEARLYYKDDDFIQNYRKAAEVHRQARRWVQESVKPGQTLLDIAEGIEDSVRALLGHAGLQPGDSLKAGLGFPTGLCLNHQMAHYTPNPGQKDVVLQQHDVMKVDFGVHINGWIVDSAFTMAFDHTYDGLLAAVKDATNAGVKVTIFLPKRAAGIDVRISDVSAAIQEAMESHEVEIRGKTFRVKPVRNLCAHDIKQYRIHGGKSIPFVKNSDQTKMEEGEVFAIETFGTTGRGYVRDDVGIYGYGLNHDAPLAVPLPLASARRLHKTIRENFSTLVFCRRYLDRLGAERYLAGMNCLVSNGIVEPHLPLMDIEGSYSAQFEHTLLLRETHKEVFSRGDDY
ncbi:methionine aminopeptidase, type II [Cladophialophora bantiana CBS 173.52]|uniref:Methionine aminopeptidase 2 n=1 Tax=Cladophialophora bantiana (strain ATCC 10958 / CBS 173.52 / CDC B-1940 / NIH 8579) TaxID=1442370 RepID=A0A0D2HWI9_CLAB1|nr:methionine aminopeptidase, type II [Cladophialophora bantiana CBS 173.52]KIW88919.1 methionine aminopeptidase, type II [Cladophialophora bantiana CBS 173.52]